MGKIEVSRNRILKLTNVVSKELSYEEVNNLQEVVENMEMHIRLKGGKTIGPLIQYTELVVDETGKGIVITKVMRQCSDYINGIEKPYEIQSLIRCKNCMYVRFVGEEQNIKFAYDKISLNAYEEDIKLKGNSYTIFVNNQDDNVIADVFMECIDDVK